MVVFALFINRVDQWWIVLLCALAVVFNIVFLPALTNRKLEYPNSSTLNTGLISYPSVLLFLALLFFENPIFMAIGWVAMAFGDGFAGLIGPNVKSPSIPWCKNKTIFGSVTFVVFATIGIVLILRLIPNEVIQDIPPYFLVFMACTSAVVAGITETIEGFIDDNIPVALTSSLLFYVFYLIQPVQFPGFSMGLLPGVAACFSLAAIAYYSKSLMLSGAVAGFGVAFCSSIGFGWSGLVILFLFVSVGIGATKWRQNTLALPEDHRPRDYKNVLSNGILACLVALTAFMNHSREPLLFIIFAAIFSAALSDTLSSEIGVLYGKRFYQFPNFKKTVSGTDGAISLEGTLAGVFGAMVVGTAYAYFTHEILHGLIVLVAGVLANLFDSLLGTLFQNRRLMNNHTVNVANTFFAGLCAHLLFRLF